MKAGSLTEKIDIYQRTNSINSYGDVTPTWTEFKTDVYCRILALGTPSAGASEFSDDRQTTGEMKVEFICRWVSGVDFDMRLKWNGAYFDIYSILPFGRREGMRIRARRRDFDEGTNPSI